MREARRQRVGTLTRPLTVVAAKIRLLWALSLFCFVSYFVLGGILAGHATLSAAHPFITLGLLAVLITILAVVEGLHLCVGRLGLKDLGALRDQYPRAYKLHQWINTASGTNRFLAGRQLVVIVVVFFVARITSFSTMQTWPLTSVIMPAALRSAWFQEIFLNLGILGAFFVLWFGQLIPQFVATKKPVAFLNLYGMEIALRTCFFIEALGLTKPGDWLARWVSEEQAIPPSPQERNRKGDSGD